MCKYQNDAEACYDSIIPQHAMICSRKFNVPKKVCQLVATTFNKTKYHVQTAVRTSPNYITHQQNKCHYMDQVRGQETQEQNGYSLNNQ